MSAQKHEPDEPQAPDDSNERLRNAMHPEAFRRSGHALIEQLAAQLTRAHARAVVVSPSPAPEELLARYPAAFPEARASDEEKRAFYTRVLADSTQLHSPRFLGHQVSAPLPEAVLLETLSAFLNNGTGVFEMGPASNAMERSVLGFLCEKLGMPTGSGGLLTSGGSLGNLTALLAMRQARAGHDAWMDGTSPNLCVLASEETHYSVARAVQILGWGKDGVWPVRSDATYRMGVAALGPALAAARARGRQVLGVIACAGSTATGSFDPLADVADFCAREGLWLHVDGAHGASVAMSRTHRGLLAGIERADSVVWDAHKMMMLPALVTAVLFRSEAHAPAAFAQEQSYLFDGQGAPWWDSGLRTLECTKRMMSVELYGALLLCGTRVFEDQIDRTFALAHALASRITDSPDFELGVAPDCNIVCFRHVPSSSLSAERLDVLQGEIRARIREQGELYLVQARLRGRLHLRVTVMNGLTTEADLDALLTEIRAAARKLLE